MNWKKWLLRSGIVGIVVAALSIGLLYNFQERIIFQQPSMSHAEAEKVTDRYDHVKEITFQSEGGEWLHGWLLDPEKGESEAKRLLIFYGGNNGELSREIRKMSRYLQDWSVLLVNYRGYGMSEGSPGEEALYADALMIYDELQDQLEGEITSTFLMGRSLGTAVATKVASERQVDGLVLISPFDTLTEVARLHLPFLPVSWILRHHFDSQAHIGNTSVPLLVITGEDDQIVPAERSQALFADYKGPKQYEILTDRDHKNLHMDDRFWPAIQQFLDSE
ncbi:alpha/beta hydrolase [Natribacillus halophilus]|uniref:alpha/beta hydrolase n=1 Tax=Natribacillus halophilus TaxID=549003 RepID=UPI000B83D830|nr:alpha/beta fold hydrolase [Natribacillus halophilus]